VDVTEFLEDLIVTPPNDGKKSGGKNDVGGVSREICPKHLKQVKIEKE
jgi:hypothetical protein